MKDITIAVSQIKKESLLFLIVLAFMIIVNMYAIIAYNGTWIELISQLPFVLAVTVILYAFIALLRLIIYAGKSIVNRLMA